MSDMLTDWAVWLGQVLGRRLAGRGGGDCAGKFDHSSVLCECIVKFVERGASKQDILPQIQSKVMYTRDLSTIWSKNHDQQKALFGVLIPILDGKG